MERTAEQKIADYEAKIARLKEKVRKQRTRVLIVAGATLVKGFKKMTKEQQELFISILHNNASDSDKKIVAEYIDYCKE